MPGVRLDVPWAQQLNSSSVLLSGAKLYVCENETTTLVDLFSNRDATVSRANPVEADASGRFPIVYIEASQLLTVVLKTSAGVTLISADDYEPFLGAQNSYTIEGEAPAVTLRETDQTLPAGLWRVVLSGDTLRIQQNTASAGDFSSYSEFLTIPSTGIADFEEIPTVDGSQLVVTSSIIKALGLGPGGILNGALVASVATNALTIALKGVDGNDPSATNPVIVVLRSATASDGKPVTLTITAALSLVVSSGSTLGTSNGVAARLDVVIFNDAGTARLGVANGVTLDTASVFSSTAEGGGGAADSSGVIYTGTAVSSKALAILGHIDITEATAGTWATAPTTVATETNGATQSASMIPIQDTAAAFRATNVEAALAETRWTYASPITTSGAATYDVTGIPAGVSEIQVTFAAVSLSGTDEFLIQIGDSGGIESAGYLSGTFTSSSETTSTAGFIMDSSAAGDTLSGMMTLARMSSDGTVWGSIHGLATSGGNARSGGGQKTLSAELDRVRLAASGANTFDAGTAYVRYR